MILHDLGFIKNSFLIKFHPGNVNIIIRPGLKRIHSVVWIVPGFVFPDLYKSNKILTVQKSLEIVCQCWGMMIELFDWTLRKPLGETLLLNHATALLLFLFLGFIFCAASALFSTHVVDSSATNPSFAPSKLRNMHALLKGKASVMYRLPWHCSSGLSDRSMKDECEVCTPRENTNSSRFPRDACCEVWGTQQEVVYVVVMWTS